jgi:cell surface protein SprA
LSNTGSGENYNNTSSYNENQNMCFVACTATLNLEHYKTVIKKNFLVRGRYKSSGGDGIPIGALNVGSVVVTAAGRILVEGIDYSVTIN